MLGHGSVEGEQVLDHRGRVVGEHLHVTGVTLHGTRAQLEARGVGDHSGVGLVPDPQAVLAQQVGGVGVVGQDGGLELLVLLVRPTRLVRRGGHGQLLTEHARGGQRHPDARAQLAGGLGGEGQPEHLVGPDLPGDDEVDHPGGHQRGLARPRAGDHHGRAERCGDRGPLLGADLVVAAHHLAQVGWGVDGPHSCTTDPALRAGQIGTNGQRSQWGPGVAGKVSVRK